MRLLIVEDEVKVAGFLKRGMEEAGHVVDVAHTGEDGEYYASLNKYDVMILDVMLPDKDGRQVCRDLRAKGVSTPAIILTAKSSTEDKILGFDSGADQFVVKPFDFNELLARVRVLGRHADSAPIRSLTVADLQIDQLTRTVKRGAREITLTTKEYQLLELLARHAGQVVLRTIIIEQIWDMRHDPTTNSVDALVKNLRDKIERDFEPKLIHTVRGVGYILKAK